MRWVRAGFLPVSVLILVVAAMVVPLPLVAERPGRTLSLAACVDVEHEKASSVDGDFLLMTISVQGSTTVGAISALRKDVDLVPRRHVIPHGIDTNTYFRDQREEFALMADRAAAVGLSAAGLRAEVTGDGVVVVGTQPGTPADGVLEPGDLIVAVNDESIEDDTELRHAVAALSEGQAAVLDITRRGKREQVSLTPVLLDGRRILGVHPETENPRVELPVPVDVAAGAIGGPSAGLMIALTVYDQVLPEVDLARGRTVAGTGSIDDEGRVGPIGGAGLKVIAAARAGAEIFLAPAANYDEAVAALPRGSAMKVVSVATFGQARKALAEQPAKGSKSRRSRDQRCPYDNAA